MLIQIYIDRHPLLAYAVQIADVLILNEYKIKPLCKGRAAYIIMRLCL